MTQLINIGLDTYPNHEMNYIEIIFQETDDDVACPDCPAAPRTAGGRRRTHMRAVPHLHAPFVHPTARPHPTPQPPCIASG